MRRFFRTIQEAAQAVLRIEERITRMLQTVEELAAAIEAFPTVVEGVITLVDDLEKRLADALASEHLSPETQAKLDQALLTYKANATKLSDALVAGTQPPAPVPTPEPAPTPEPGA